MRRQMKEFQRQHQQGQFQENATNAFNNNTTTNKTTQNNDPAPKPKSGDYIDFEEIK